MTDQMIKEKTEKTIIVSADFLEEIVHAVGSLAQYFMNNYFLEYGVYPDVTQEDALIMQGVEYLRQGGAA